MLHLSSPSFLLVAGMLVGLLHLSRRRRNRLPLPPGPPKLPLLGNLLDMPVSSEWETYWRWSKECNSDIIHLDAAGTSIVVLSSIAATTDLLDKRSTLYSDRPRLPMLNELMGWDFNFVLLYIPRWVPGAGFKRIAHEWRKLSIALVNQPFDETKRQLATGDAPPSFTSSLLTATTPIEHEVIKNAAATTYSAGADTTVAVLGKFMLAMLANPEAQRRAQSEIDVVCGGRLPGFEMFKESDTTMPFVSAIIRELFRWQPTVPFVPHFIETEDEYRGFRIPAQSIVVGNIWAILQDEERYPDAKSFVPDRWLLPSGALNPEMHSDTWQFGFGFRTSCLRGAISCVVVPVDNHCFDPEPPNEFVEGLIRQPVPFKCSIKPRSVEAEMTIRETE
ncbi:Cytochrome p450 [Mycena indigotica]|uniref:Cytochrome p450 n=1 Tax=Mycena indigotica TaxID=2126181 RepID=A0A8H6RYL4_9AGAR|nr:Cytochrome p450 [Mycena indigotica]KAF7288960.1 Cytochrome p450 [Mycena indigotica]